MIKFLVANTLRFIPALFFMYYSGLEQAAAARRSITKLIVVTQVKGGRKLPNVPFTFNASERKTGPGGKATLRVKPNKRCTVIFGEVEGYSLLAPKGGQISVRVRRGRTKRVRAVYQAPLTAPLEICSRPVDLVETGEPNSVVGNGTPQSCTEAALKSALSSGGIITFNCGSAPVAIPITSEKKISTDTVLDGGGLITLDAAGKSRILNMDTGNFEAVSPHLTVQRLTFRGGRVRGPLLNGSGGAIYYRGGSVTAIDCTFADNSAEESGPDVGGGAIYGIGVGKTTIVGSQFIGNRASNGGAIGALHTAVTVVNSVVRDNWAAQGGGAIYMDGVGRTLALCGSTFQNNSTGSLGGVLFRTGYKSEPSIIDRCVMDGNSVRPNSNHEQANGGGAIYLQGTTVTLTSSTISNNSSRAFAGVWILGHGDFSHAAANLTNVTISNNYTHPQEKFTTRGIGAGLIIGDNTSGTISNCTIVNNTAQFGSGIINASPLTVKNSIISNNADNEWTPLNCTGSAPARGHNNIQWPISRRDSDCVREITKTDPMMGELADNGGTTKTIVPQAGSPAFRAGSDCEKVDQLGRPRSEPCTLGAYE